MHMPKQKTASSIDSLATHKPSKFYAKIFLGVLSITLSVLLIASLFYSLKYGLMSKNFMGKSEYTPSEEYNSAMYPYFPQSFAATEDMSWKIHFIQPVVEDFYTDKDANFITVKINDIAFRIFVSGKIDNTLENSVYFIENGEAKPATFEELKTKFQKGERIWVSYLSSYVDKDTRDFATCKDLRDYCTRADFTDIFKDLGMLNISTTEVQNDKVIVALEVSKDLYEN